MVMRACLVAAWWRVEEQRGAARMDGRPSAFKRVSRSLEATQFSRIGSPDAAFACHLRHLLSPHPYHTLRRKLEAGTPLPMSLRAFAAARAAEGRSARAGRDLQQRHLPLYVCYYYPLERVAQSFARSPSVRSLPCARPPRLSRLANLIFAPDTSRLPRPLLTEE